MNEYFENPLLLFKKCGLDSKSIKTPFFKGSKTETKECSICMNDVSGEDMLSLSCKHFLCRNCWKGYLKNAVTNDGQNCLNKNCPYPKCTLICNEIIFKEVLNEDLFAKYINYMKNSFIDDNPNLRWCPNSNCKKIVSVKSKFIRGAVCVCGEKFCFDCFAEPHDPLSCENYKDWLFQINTKQERFENLGLKRCPNCGKNIEKNGGCNYMQCYCGHGFCWDCLNPHNHFDHRCDFKQQQKFEGFKDNEYFQLKKKYKTHHKSQKLEILSRDKVYEIIENENLSEIESEYLKKGFQMLYKCRGVLKFAYPLIFYSQDEKEKNLIKFSLTDLENFTERLSFLLENSPLKEKKTIISLIDIVQVKIDYVLKGV